MSSLRFDEEEVKERAGTLLREPPATHRRSDDDLNPDWNAAGDGALARPAAVLIPLVARRPEVTVLLTQRAEYLAMHAGQIAFPGGRVDDADADVVMTALREAQEETGLNPEFIEPIGFLEAYLTGTNFLIVPVVALVAPGFRADPGQPRGGVHLRGAAALPYDAAKLCRSFKAVARAGAAFSCHFVRRAIYLGSYGGHAEEPLRPYVLL